MSFSMVELLNPMRWLQLAQAAEPVDRTGRGANDWLNHKPIVLVLIFVALGIVLTWFGVNDLRSGQARGKWGRTYTGITARLIGLVRSAGWRVWALRSTEWQAFRGSGFAVE